MLSNRALEMIESSFSDFMLEKSTESEFVERLAIALNNLPFNSEKQFTISLTRTNSGIKRDFYGFNVFPSIEENEKLCSLLAVENYKFEDIVKVWRDFDKWEILIDALVFDRSFIAFNPKELTAMLLHEIGYVTQSDEPIELFYRAYKECNEKMISVDKVSKKVLFMLYTIPLAIACTTRRWINEKSEIAIDISSDRSLIESGYSNYLVNAYDKVIKATGSLEYSKGDNFNRIEAEIEWANKNIVDVVKRRDKMKDSLYYKAIQSNSSYVRALCERVLTNLGVKMRERYSGYVVESCMLNELISGEITLETHIPVFDLKKFGFIEGRILREQKNLETATEAFFNKRKKSRVDIPDDYAIDRIFVAVDDIQNNYDKVYVLDMIYELIEQLNNFEEAIALDESKAKKWAPKIEEIRTRLAVLRKYVLDKNVSKKEYKLFVKVPEGYEG